MQMNTSLCTHTEPHANRAACKSTGRCARMHSRVRACTSACLYAQPRAGLHSHVLVCTSLDEQISSVFKRVEPRAQQPVFVVPVLFIFLVDKLLLCAILLT